MKEKKRSRRNSTGDGKRARGRTKKKKEKKGKKKTGKEKRGTANNNTKNDNREPKKNKQKRGSPSQNEDVKVAPPIESPSRDVTLFRRSLPELSPTKLLNFTENTTEFAFKERGFGTF